MSVAAAPGSAAVGECLPPRSLGRGIRPHGAQVLKAPKENIFPVMRLETISHMLGPSSLQGHKPKNVLDTLEAKETFPVSRSYVKSLQNFLQLVVHRFFFFILFAFCFFPHQIPSLEGSVYSSAMAVWS